MADYWREVLELAARQVGADQAVLERYTYHGPAASPVTRQGWRLAVGQGALRAEVSADVGPPPVPVAGPHGAAFDAAIAGLTRCAMLSNDGYGLDAEPIVTRHGFVPRLMPESLQACRVVADEASRGIEALALDAVHLLGLQLVWGAPGRRLQPPDVPRYREVAPLLAAARPSDARWLLLLWESAAERAAT